MAQIFNLQKYAAKDFNGLVTQNHLQMLYMQEPELISPYIQDIYTNIVGGGYVTFLNRFPIEYIKNENEWFEWQLHGGYRKNLPLLDVEDSQGNKLSDGSLTDVIGTATEEFYLIFPEDLFEINSVLRGMTEDQMVVVRNKESYTNGYIRYRVQLHTDNMNLGLDPADIALNTDRWSKDHNLQPSTLSSRGNEPWFTSPFRLHNRLSTMRYEYHAPGNMIKAGTKNYPLKFKFIAPMSNGKSKQVPVWVNFLDMMAKYQFDQEYARMAIYGHKNWTSDKQVLLKDVDNGFEVASGEGFFRQIAAGNRHFYNEFDLDKFVSILVDKGIGRLDRGKRWIDIGTGERGVIEVGQAIEAKANSNAALMQGNGPSLLRTADPRNTGSQNTYGYGGQFTEYQAYNGVYLATEIWDFLDDDIRHPQKHPAGKGLAESHRMIALDYGGDAGVSQVKAESCEDIWGYIKGMRDPYNADGKFREMSSPVDGYETHFMKVGGMKVTDPTKIIDYQLNIEA